VNTDELDSALFGAERRVLKIQAKLHCWACDPTWLNLVRIRRSVDVVENLAQVVGQGVDGGDGAQAGLDLDGAVPAGGADELPD
jgi:hypothetical protein